MTDAPKIRLESPFPSWELPRVWVWIQAFRSRIADDFAPQSLEEYVEYSRHQFERQKTWGVYRNGELGGMITFEPQTPWVGTSHCLFAKRFWGSKTTVPALQQAYSWVFGEGYSKILSFVFRDNDAIRALAMKLGAVEEGVFRDQTIRGGRPVDMVALGLRREDVTWDN